MARVPLVVLTALSAGVLVTGAAGWTQDDPKAAVQTDEAVLHVDTGDTLFRTYCASCHGTSAKGDGPLAAHLRYRPADLTLLAKHNDGRFDTEMVQRIIDGRNPVRGHGGTDMPVWGDAFKRSHESFSERAVTARVRALADYLETLQAK